MLEVFKDLFLKPGLPSTCSNLQLWAQSSGYPALAEEAKEAALHPEETEAEFNRLCIGPYRLIVVPYESAWVTGSRKLNGPVAEDVANFYAAAGLSSASLLNELPDFFVCVPLLLLFNCGPLCDPLRWARSLAVLFCALCGFSGL